MFKALSLLWLVVLLPMFFLIFPNSYSPLPWINEYAIKTMSVKQYSGTFYLLEQQLESTPSEQWQKKIEALGTQFGNELALLPLQTDSENPSFDPALLESDFVFNTGPRRLMRRMGNSQWVIAMTLDMTEQQQLIRSAKGTAYLILQVFESTPHDQWPKALAHLSKKFNTDLSILTKDKLSLDQENMAKLVNNELVWQLEAQEQSVFYRQISGGNAILRVLVPDTNSLVIWNYAAAMLTLILVISICMFLWVHPLLRDLNRLSDIAADYGDGHLQKRAALTKISVVARLAGSFNLMADKIEKLIQGHKELTNAIAHDLRAPLYRLRFAFEMLNDGDVTQQEQQKYRNSIRVSIEDLDHLINQTLVLSRYSRVMDIRHFSDCDLAETVRDEIERSRLELAHLELEYELSPEITTQRFFVDKRALLRALNNLVTNASGYANTQIKIGLHIQGGDCLLRVEDDGPGIEEAQWKIIFQPFAQLHSTHRDTASGHGLGLAIVQQIALWHKGEVSVGHSTLGGAKFEMRWPLRAS